jgi:uncharacterized membrane protein YidH (DUF202 family)
MTETLKRDKETSPQSKRPISHWLLAIGGILLAAGGIIAWSESVYSEGHATSPTYFGVLFASIGGILFSVAILVELLSIGSCVRRIEARLKPAERDARQ